MTMARTTGESTGRDLWLVELCARNFEVEKNPTESKDLCIFARNLYHLLRGHKRHPIVIGH